MQNEFGDVEVRAAAAVAVVVVSVSSLQGAMKQSSVPWEICNSGVFLHIMVNKTC